MRYAFGADDSNATTAAVLECLGKRGEVVVVGVGEQWPDIGRGVGRLVASGEADIGVVMCWNDANVLGLSLKRLSPDVAVECLEAFLDPGLEPDPAQRSNIDSLG
jgi:ribose 5-phosphate isomerase B